MGRGLDLLLHVRLPDLERGGLPEIGLRDLLVAAELELAEAPQRALVDLDVHADLGGRAGPPRDRLCHHHRAAAAVAEREVAVAQRLRDCVRGARIEGWPLVTGSFAVNAASPSTFAPSTAMSATSGRSRTS